MAKNQDLVTLYKAGQPSTMVSSRPALTLAPSQFPDLTNVRNRYGVIEVRKTDQAFSQTGLPGTTGSVSYAGGSWSGTIAGVEYALVAVKNGTAVDIYDSPDGSTWTNRSSATAKAYGITQLTDATAVANGISMQVVNDPIVGESVIISDGTTVLLWNPTSVNSERLKKVVSISTARNNKSNCIILQQITGVQVNLTTQLSLSGITWTGTSGAAGLMTIANPQAAGSILEINFAPAGNLNINSQFGIFCTVPTTSYNFLTACKLEIAQSGGGAYVTIYDPSNTGAGGIPPSIETYTNYMIAGVATSAMLVTYNVPDVFTNSITKIRFTYKGTATQFAAGTLQIYAMVSGGASTGTQAPPAGYPNYAVSYFNSATGVESVGQVLDSSAATTPNLWQLYSSSATLTPDTTALFPVSSYLRNYWSVVETTPPVPATDGAFDTFCLYRKDTGSQNYFFVNSSIYTLWTPGAPGSWSIPGGTYGVSVNDQKDINGLNYERPAPSSFNTAPPGHRCAININDRFFIGTVNEYKFSEFKFPMRHGLAVDVLNTDRSSGGYRFKSETPKSFFHIVGSVRYDQGTDKAAIVTDKTVRMIGGLDTFSLMRPTKISEFGTNAPKSFVARRETTYWVDDARRFHSHPIQPAIENRSLDVKDILDGISTTNIKLVSSATFDDRIYFFYAPSGQTVNNAAIVYDLISGSLTRDSYTVGVCSTIINGSRLLAFMSDGTMRQLETSTAGNVSNVSIVSREVGTASQSYAGKRQRVYCDGAAATTITATWTPYKVGTAGIITDATLSLAPDAGEDRTDRVTTMNKGVRGRSIKFGLSGTIPAGTKLYAWQVETEARVQEDDTA